MRPDQAIPVFLTRSRGGAFKGRNPAVAATVLQRRWLEGGTLLYVGKAARGTRGRRGLRTRVGESLAFGAGRPVAHWGGRYLWQVDDCESFLIGWKETADPEGLENELLVQFRGCPQQVSIRQHRGAAGLGRRTMKRAALPSGQCPRSALACPHPPP